MPRGPEEADGRLYVQVEDTLIGMQRRIPVDTVVLSAGPTGGVSAAMVEAPPDPAAPLEDVAATLTYKAMAGANVFVLKVADQTLGGLLDVSA